MHTIIVGADGSDRSEDALAFAHRLAQATDAQILLVDAMTPAAPTDAELVEPYLELLREEGDAVLRRMQALAGPELSVVTRTILAGSAAQALLEVADEIRADLIVVGSSHVGRLGRVLPGSTGERLLNGAPCPVAVVPRGSAGRPWDELRTIGVADDGRAESRVARDLAVTLARSTGAVLRVVRVCDAVRYGSPAMLSGPEFAARRVEVRRQVRAEAEAVLASLPSEVDAELSVLEGDPANELASVSQELDLLLLGSRGYGPLHAVFAGGVSGRVLRDAACPVIVVPRGARVTQLRAAVAAAQDGA